MIEVYAVHENFDFECRFELKKLASKLISIFITRTKFLTPAHHCSPAKSQNHHPKYIFITKLILSFCPPKLFNESGHLKHCPASKIYLYIKNFLI